MSKWEKFKSIQITDYFWVEDIVGALKLGLYALIFAFIFVFVFSCAFWLLR